MMSLSCAQEDLLRWRSIFVEHHCGIRSATVILNVLSWENQSYDTFLPWDAMEDLLPYFYSDNPRRGHGVYVYVGTEVGDMEIQDIVDAFANFRLGSAEEEEKELVPFTKNQR